MEFSTMQNIARLAIASSVIAMAAAGSAKGATPNTPPPAPAAAFEIETGIVMPPKRTGGRTGQTVYPFDMLPAPTIVDGKPINASFHVVGKTAKQMASTISSANKRNLVAAKNDDGTDKVKIIEIKDATGVKTGEKREPIMVPGKTFVAFNVEASDPKGAGVRVFRSL
jgi:hypothetical protein